MKSPEAAGESQTYPSILPVMSMCVGRFSRTHDPEGNGMLDPGMRVGGRTLTNQEALGLLATQMGMRLELHQLPPPPDPYGLAMARNSLWHQVANRNAKLVDVVFTRPQTPPDPVQ